ncbi:MAG: methionyl-tRNA formyltransferase, partial [Bacteroidia bacterium]|nr:methionyl-tRNA formyltransferase [Bacteroidia bacterium]MDW8236662.1 methionyl-tRNA formyltransferase [Bacteroidia bacterium]
MKVVFFGNGSFGLPALRRLVSSPHKVLYVVTNPDKPAGRGNKLTPTPVKEEALRLGLPVREVDSLKDPELFQWLRSLGAHAFVVVAYRILPREIWEIPSLGALNIHPSLLPAYRGAAPIPWTLIRGEKQTGITIFRIKEGIDTGDIILQRPYPIPYDWNAGQLERFLSEIGADLLLEALEGLAMGTLTPQPQPPQPDAPYAPKLTSENTKIHWDQPVEKVYNFIRGLAPLPRAWTVFQNKRLLIGKAGVVNGRKLVHPPGTLWQEEERLLVACQDMLLE